MTKKSKQKVKASASSTKPPKFIRDALQALAFWLGYQEWRMETDGPIPDLSGSSDYRTLFESAVVEELARLLQARASGTVLTERLYSEMLPKGTKLKACISGKKRADIAIASSKRHELPPGTNVANCIKFVIEVKRTGVTTDSMVLDLARLDSWLERKTGDGRAFLVLVTQGQKPPVSPDEDELVNDKGKSSRELHKAQVDSEGREFIQFRAIRVLKASASFSADARAHYVTLIEVIRQAKTTASKE